MVSVSGQMHNRIPTCIFLLFRSRSIYNKASQAIRSPRTVPFLILMSLLDGYSFANVHVKGIVAFKHFKKNCDLDLNHRPLKHEPIKDMFILSICETLY